MCGAQHKQSKTTRKQTNIQKKQHKNKAYEFTEGFNSTSKVGSSPKDISTVIFPPFENLMLDVLREMEPDKQTSK